ncbi:hypothetical protein EBZ80_25905 [bacterium]|nr:hypothetical protein [bacterium]
MTSSCAEQMMMDDTTAATTSFAWPAMERAMKRVVKNHVDANVKSFLRVVAEEYQLEEEPLARSWEAFATSAAAGARTSQRVVVTAATTGVKKKRGMTAYNLFCKMERQAVLEKYPGTTSKEVMKRLGDEWKMLTDADKEAWKQRRLALDAEEGSSTQSVSHVANASASETAPPPPTPTSPKSPPRPSVLFTDTAATTEEEEDDYLQSFQTKLQRKTEEQLRKLCRRYDLPSGSKEAMIRVMMARVSGRSP